MGSASTQPLQVQALRKRVAEFEAQLKERDLGVQRFQDLTSALVDWFWEIDHEGRYTYTSGRVFDLLGYTPEEVLGRRPFDLMDSETAHEVEARFEEIAARRDPIVNLVNWNLGKEGQRVCLLTNGVPILDNDGELRGYRGVDQDITATQENAERLAISEQRLRAVLDTLPDVLLIVDEDGRYLEAHTADHRLLYKPLEEIRGTRIDEIYSPQRAALFLSVVRDAIASGTLQRLEYELDVPLGRRWFEGRCLRIEQTLHGKQAAVFVARDITDRKLAEFDLARSNRDLAQFAAIASHDLREPLRTIGGHLGLLERHLDEHLDEESRELLSTVLEGAQRMNRLVGDLLAFSRVGSTESPLAAVELGDALELARAALRTALDENDATIDSHELPCVWGNEAQLAQLLQNLLANALKFRSADAPKITVSAKAQGEQWIIRVQDNGLGVEVGQQERIFEAFVRAPTKEQRPGSGIGLAICRKIVEHHGGRIWVDSQPGAGSCFVFTLRASPG
ncbi:MAG: hypothetical protein CSA65_03960 [Proteobacteria bacterium]|nr:MAG: hypothetical protein CSA65_03960 [Pseudomonadota bacterium]